MDMGRPSAFAAVDVSAEGVLSMKGIYGAHWRQGVCSGRAWAGNAWMGKTERGKPDV